MENSFDEDLDREVDLDLDYDPLDEIERTVEFDDEDDYYDDEDEDYLGNDYDDNDHITQSLFWDRLDEIFE